MTGRARFLGPALAGLALAGVLSACNSGTPTAKSATGTTGTTGGAGGTGAGGGASGTTSPAGTAAVASSTTGPAAASTTSPLAPPCSTSTLSAAIDQAATVNGAGSVHLAIVLTNTGTAACSLEGYPSVQLLGASGSSGATGAPGSSGATGGSTSSAGGTAGGGALVGTSGPTTSLAGTGGATGAPAGSSSAAGATGAATPSTLPPTTPGAPPSAASGSTSLGAGGPVPVSVADEGPAGKLVDLAPGQRAGFYLYYATVPVDGKGCSPVSTVEVTPPGAGGSLPIGGSLSVCGGGIGVYAIAPIASLGS